MESENSTGKSRPKSQRNLNLESSQRLPNLSKIKSNNFEMAVMSPMTNLVHNLSGASLDSTPKRRFLSHDNLDADMETFVGTKGSLALTSGELLGSLSEKENSYTSIRSFAAAVASPEKPKSAEDFISRRSPRRLALTRLDVNSPNKARVDINSPIKTNFAKPAQPVSSGIPSTRLPSIEDVDSQDSGCFPEDSKYFKYPEPLCHRRMSDRNTSPASIRSSSSSLSAGGSQKYDGPVKLDFSFMSNGDDEGIPDELYEEEDQGLPTSVSLSQLIATPLSERATRQFSHEDSLSPPAYSVAKTKVDESMGHNEFLRVPKEAAVVEKFGRPSFRRSQSMFDQATPTTRNACYDSPLNQSPVARGLFLQDEDSGSSPLPPLGLHALRLRMQPSRVIQPVGGPPFKRSEPSSADSAVQQQENKRRKDDNDDRPVFTSLDHNVGNNNKTAALSRLPHRIQRCHSETEATIMRALQRSTEEPDLIGDFTRPFALPLTAGKHQDLKCITPQTLVDLINGKFQDYVEKYTIIDCRYPYEYENGHINDAVNLWTKDMVWSVFMEGKRQQAPSTTHDQEKKRNILIFHCEFSSERGPALSRFLRNKDRDDNKDNYPALHWPEVYLLLGGYKAFYEQFDEMCEPRGYLPMNQQGREEELRKCRAKTKSCNGEGKSGRPLTKSTSRRLELL
ncbi:M-phase inducer phosphatase 2-like isoform X1 [Daphnia carinata]|uniref:M-phase inducer phosphatase 2-like isoform X1 n=1 Tax=Daphnia carinata TaxID=120202 RepID=UPI00257BDE72|nr:M-phase inducer phosphatase 2-like isoform X1 [Daphnia carinata]